MYQALWLGEGRLILCLFCHFTTPSRKLSLQTASMHSESPHNPNFPGNQLFNKGNKEGWRQENREAYTLLPPPHQSFLFTFRSN